MLWVDTTCYFGPDRRRKRVMRMLERRRENYAGSAPSLSIAMRQLRMRVLDARGRGATAFADRAHGVSILARMNDEPDAADALESLAMIAMRAGSADCRPSLYVALDGAHAALSDYR